jgi:hypothetical protein
MVRLPGLREHPGTAAVLLLILLCAGGIFLVTRFRRVFTFLGGFATGVILSGMIESYFTGGLLLTEPLRFAQPDPMDLLAGLVAGVLFLLFERFFALILTTSLGAYLCVWALGGRWTFVVCFLLGLVVQLVIFARIGKPDKGKGNSRSPLDRSGSGKKGSTALTGLLIVMLIPSVSMAAWEVERIVTPSSRIVMGAGWRDGVRLGEKYAVVDGRGSLIAVIAVSEVFSDSAYSDPLPAETIRLVDSGMTVLVLEDYEYRKALEYGGESRLQSFLRKYPRSRYRQDVVDALDKTRFRLAEMIGTIDSYMEFQRNYPTSRFAPEAVRRAEVQAFQKAREAGTEEAFRSFLDRFPGNGILSGMTEVRHYFRTRETGLVYAFRDFKATYPDSPFSDEFTGVIEEFEVWARRLEFGSDPVGAIRYFGEKGD